MGRTLFGKAKLLQIKIELLVGGDELLALSIELIARKVRLEWRSDEHTVPQVSSRSMLLCFQGCEEHTAGVFVEPQADGRINPHDVFGVVLLCDRVVPFIAE